METISKAMVLTVEECKNVEHHGVQQSPGKCSKRLVMAGVTRKGFKVSALEKALCMGKA
jgi:hypothetical protein